MKIKTMCWFSAAFLFLALSGGHAASLQTPQAQTAQPNAPVKVDTQTISGLGARNIGSASGGVCMSGNGGSIFKPVFDKQPVRSIGAITIDPKDSKVIWVGTGESWTRNSVSIGDGVYKSVDGGDNWTNMGLKESERISKMSTRPNQHGLCLRAGQAVERQR